MDIRSQIKQLSYECGFKAVGLASLRQESEGFRRFQQWLDRGYEGEMRYLREGAEKRKNPALVLEGAKSIIVLTWGYTESVADPVIPVSPGNPRLASRDSGLAGGPLQKCHPLHKCSFISRYAWGEDYHLILGKKLLELEEKLCQRFPGAHFKSYVDTGPVMEKYWASLAGIGWIGKHTNLIHPERGSYFFLASLLTDLELEPDHPVQDHCGRCTACIEVCPTRAIVAPYVLDARLCISYLTIELKGPIPRELRPLMGTHIFGCDDCQELCPWNRHARLPLEFFRNPSVTELIDHLSLDEETFKKRFEKSAILRPKRKGFLRNVCVALGNLKDPSAIPALSAALNDKESLIRAHAAWALGQFREESVRASLLARKELEKVEEVREEITLALGD